MCIRDRFDRTRTSEWGSKGTDNNGIKYTPISPGSVQALAGTSGSSRMDLALVAAFFQKPTSVFLIADGEPEDVSAVVSDYAEWLSISDIPKLFIDADPGAILTGVQREFCRNWPNQKEITVPGSHFIQEDSPHEIGQAIAEWVKVI